MYAEIQIDAIFITLHQNHLTGGVSFRHDSNPIAVDVLCRVHWKRAVQATTGDCGQMDELAALDAG